MPESMVSILLRLDLNFSKKKTKILVYIGFSEIIFIFPLLLLFGRASMGYI